MIRFLNIFLLLVLISTPLFAAEEEAAAGQAEQQQTPGADDTTATADGGTQDPGGAANAAGVDSADARAPETDENGLTLPPSDEDFVPSVRITEDLPVAFPVDI